HCLRCLPNRLVSSSMARETARMDSPTYWLCDGMRRLYHSSARPASDGSKPGCIGVVRHLPLATFSTLNRRLCRVFHRTPPIRPDLVAQLALGTSVWYDFGFSPNPRQGEHRDGSAAESCAREWQSTAPHGTRGSITSTMERVA